MEIASEKVLWPKKAFTFMEADKNIIYGNVHSMHYGDAKTAGSPISTQTLWSHYT